MPGEAKDAVRREVVSALNTVARRHGLEVAESGKTARMRELDAAAGYWAEPTTVTAKPPRWIIQLAAHRGDWIASVPNLPGSRRTAYFNTANRYVGVGCFRIALAVKWDDVPSFAFPSDWDWLLWFAFSPALRNGSSGQLLDDFDPSTGILTYMGQRQPYVAAGLVCLSPPTEEFAIAGRTLTYGQATEAIQGLIHVAPQVSVGGAAPAVMPMASIDVFDATNTASRLLLTEKLDAAFRDAKTSTADAEGDGLGGGARIPEFPGLIGLPPSISRQIEAALNSGKRHLMLYGPPGTGKTTLAQLVAGCLADQWKLITASADWTSQDIIGGYMPLEGGRLRFLPGILLSNFDRPLIIDELNRCDIDKVIGPLFTVLSGHPTTLPYLTEPGNPESPRYTILPESKPDRSPHEFAPSRDWRLIATINTVDKSSLYQMSYALSRRFAWIFVDVPASTSGFLLEWLRSKGMIPADGDLPTSIPLGQVWAAVNAIRPLGPAPAIDSVMYMRSAAGDETVDQLAPITGAEDARVEMIVDALVVFFLPLLDGISRQEGETLVSDVRAALSLAPEHALADRLRRSVLAICI